MLIREEACGLRSRSDYRGLIYPVRYSDGEHFPSEAAQIQHKDLRKWNSPHRSFEFTADYPYFDQLVQEICRELADMIDRAPAWSDWPLIDPETLKTPSTEVHLPRL
jgi:hypothetical protein